MFTTGKQLFQASIQQIAATDSQHSLQHETQNTLQKLKTLSSSCTHDLESLILTKQKQLPGQVFYCSISSIVIDLAEIIVDTAFFGFEAYEEIPALLKDLKELRKCLKETTAEAMATCALEFLPGTVQAVEVIAGGLENYVGEMQMIVPLLWEEILQCQTASETEYKAFLESTLDKAKRCSLEGHLLD